jgi:mRNA interferase HicA
VNDRGTTDVLTRQQTCCILYPVRSSEFKRWLEKQGCTFEPGRGGHLTVRRGKHITDLPMHGKGKELGTGLVNAIKKQLGLK